MRRTYLWGIAAVLALAGLATWAASDRGPTADTAVEDCVAAGTCSPGPDGEPIPTSLNGFTVEGTYQGLPVGFTEEGFPFIGEPEAPVTILEYSDYLCPFCFRHTTQTTPSLLLRYGNAGEINLVFKDFPLAGLHPTAPTGHNASLCVAEQGAVLFWGFHDLLFRNQEQWASIPDPGEYLSQSAEAVGADMAAYTECMESGRNADLVAERVAEAEGLGFNGTPSFQLVANADGASYDLVGAQPLEVFTGAIDAMLAGDTPAGLSPSSGVASQEVSAAAPTFAVDPDSLDTYAGMPVGFTEDGYPYIGDPKARVTVLEYSDYLCPFCFRHATQTTPALLDQYATGNDVSFVFRDLPLASLHPTAPEGHVAANCVGEQGAAFYWAYHDTLFFNQSDWADLPDPGAYLAETAERLGVDMDAYTACVESGRWVPIVDQRVAEGSAAGFNGTPSFQFLDNETGDIYELVGAHPLERFQSNLNAMIAGEVPPDAAATEEQPEGLPYWANQEGLVPDPNRPGYTMAGDPFKGEPDAPVVVVEFSDFQCPACQRHALEAQPTIDQTFVDTGEVMWVYKHFPLRIHPQAPVAGAAAECAGDQGRFFDMDRALFESQEGWSIADPDPVFVDLARGLGLDVDRFSTCLGSREPLERVLADFYDAGTVAAETPTFVIVYGGQGRRLEGAQSAEDFVAILETEVKSARSVNGEG